MQENSGIIEFLSKFYCFKNITSIIWDMKTYKRRQVLKALYLTPALGIAASCKENKQKPIPQANALLKKDPKAMELSRAMAKKDLFSMLGQRVKQTMEKSHNCAQTTFFVLSEQFGLGGDDILKALTPLPGIAERGETCGAITGSLMAMGLIYGRDRLDDWETYRKSMIPTGRFCEKFKARMGSTSCCKIQEKAFGKCFNLMNKDDLQEFQRADATAKCSKVVSTAVNIAAEIILEEHA